MKDRLALERMRTVDAVLFDKTGTLTKGAHIVRASPDAGIATTRRCASRRRWSRTPNIPSPGRSSPRHASAARSVGPATSNRSPVAASKRPSMARAMRSVGRHCSESAT